LFSLEPIYGRLLPTAHAAANFVEIVALVLVDFLPNQLSGGERQRVAIARALANRSAIILADEPTGNLDSKNTADIMRLLADLKHTQGTTLIVVTHNHEVACVGHRVITLRDGKIQQDLALAIAFDRSLLDFKSSALGQASCTTSGCLRSCAPSRRSCGRCSSESRSKQRVEGSSPRVVVSFRHPPPCDGMLVLR
jgi:ABC-type methionine transport system ATPase subunit